MNKQMQELRLELMTMQVMIYSLAYIQNNDKNKIAKWEKECKKEAKKILKEYDESDGAKNE